MEQAEISLIEDWAGWLLMFVSYVLIWFNREARKDFRVAMALVFVLTLHHAIALTNAYITTTPVAEYDAAHFHRSGLEIATGTYVERVIVGAYFYRALLGFFYATFGISHFFGEQLSILAFLLSCFAFLKILRILGLERWNPLLVVLFGALPSMVVHGSITLRESCQILFLLLSVYCGLRYHLYKEKPRLFLCGLFAVSMGMFHQALMAHALFLFCLMSYWEMQKTVKWNKVSYHRVFGIAFLVIIGPMIVMLDESTLAEEDTVTPISIILEGEALSYAESSREIYATVYGRTTYATPFDSSSFGSMLETIGPVLAYYFFAPFPWQVTLTNPVDVYAGLEALLRLALILCAIAAWLKSSGLRRRCFSLIWLVFLSMEVMWAMGTINYGTAGRHHLVAYGLLVILGGPGLLTLISKINSRRSLFSKSVSPLRRSVLPARR